MIFETHCLFFRDGIEVACVVEQRQKLVHSLAIPKNGVLERVDEEDICEVRLDFGIPEIFNVRESGKIQGNELGIS